MMFYFFNTCLIYFANVWFSMFTPRMRSAYIFSFSYCLGFWCQDYTNLLKDREGVLFFHCFCNNVLRIQFKTMKIDHLTSLEVRSLKWVSLGQHEGLSRATLTPEALGEIQLYCLLPFPLCRGYLHVLSSRHSILTSARSSHLLCLFLTFLFHL